MDLPPLRQHRHVNPHERMPELMIDYYSSCSGCGAGGASSESQEEADAIRAATCTCK